MAGHTHSGTTAASIGRSGMEKLTDAVARRLLQVTQGWPEELQDRHRQQAREIVAAVEAAGFRIVRK